MRKFYRGTLSLEETRDYIERHKKREVPYNPNIHFSCYDGKTIETVGEATVFSWKKIEHEEKMRLKVEA